MRSHSSFQLVYLYCFIISISSEKQYDENVFNKQTSLDLCLLNSCMHKHFKKIEKNLGISLTKLPHFTSVQVIGGNSRRKDWLVMYRLHTLINRQSVTSLHLRICRCFLHSSWYFLLPFLYFHIICIWTSLLYALYYFTTCDTKISLISRIKILNSNVANIISLFRDL